MLKIVHCLKVFSSLNGIFSVNSNHFFLVLLDISSRRGLRIIFLGGKKDSKRVGDYEGTAVRKPYFDRSDKKRTQELFGEIQAMIDNDRNKSIRFIGRDMGVSAFLIKQVMHKDIQYFSYEMRKGRFLSQAMKASRKTALQSFSARASIPSNRTY